MGGFTQVTVERSVYPDGGTDYILSFTPRETVPRLSLWRRFARLMMRERPLAPPGALTLRNVSAELADRLVAAISQGVV